MLGKIVSAIRNPFEFYSSIGLLSRQDETLRRYGKAGYSSTRAIETYEKLLLDPVVLGAFDKLVTEITSRPLQFQGGNKTTQKFIENVLYGLGKQAQVTKAGTLSGEPSRGFTSLIRHLALAVITGLSVAECEWRLVDGKAVVTNLIPRDARRIGYALNDDNQLELRVVSRDELLDGEPVAPRSLVVYRYWTHDNKDIYGGGLGQQLFELVRLRSLKIKDWELFANKNAAPTGIATYPIGLQDEEVDNLFTAVQGMGEKAAMVVPENVTVEWISPSGDANVYKDFLDYIDKQIVTLICGENAVGQEGEGGSRARDQVADSVRVRRAKNLADEIAATLNQTIVSWLVELNFGDKAEVPKLEFDFSDLEQELTAEQALDFAKQLSEIGYEMGQETLQKALGFKIKKLSDVDIQAELGGSETDNLAPVDDEAQLEPPPSE